MNIRLITYKGETLSLKDWGARTGIPFSTIASRLKLGWDLERALTTRPNRDFAKGGRPAKEEARRPPAMKHHKATSRAYARWWSLGTRHVKYFGPWGSDASKAAYRQFVAEWDVGAPLLPEEIRPTIAAVIDAWLAHCRRTYRKRGTVTSEVHCCASAARPLNRAYGHTLADEFDGRRFQTVRDSMMKSTGWTRKTINDHCARIRRMFSWAFTEKLVPLDVVEAVERVEPLAAGRNERLRENQPVEEVPEPHILAVLDSEKLDRSPARRKLLADMIRIQLLTGMRPGELCSLTRADIDRSQKTWKYEVRAFNKMLHKDIEREVYFGPEARAILEPYLIGDEHGAVFVLVPYRAKAAPRPVTVQFLCRAVVAACKAEKVPEWTPNQLRHNRATQIMDAYEDDSAAAAVLGNTPEVARQIYVGKHRAKEKVARRIAEETG